MYGGLCDRHHALSLEKTRFAGRRGGLVQPSTHRSDDRYGRTVGPDNPFGCEVAAAAGVASWAGSTFVWIARPFVDPRCFSAPRLRALFSATAAPTFVATMILFSVHAVCDLQYTCGCLPLGLGGTDPCNMHVPETADCPWCTGGPVRLAGVGAVVILPAARVCWLGRRRRWTFVGTVGGALVVYLLGAAVAGLMGALVTDYPTWLGFVRPLRFLHCPLC